MWTKPIQQLMPLSWEQQLQPALSLDHILTSTSCRDSRSSPSGSQWPLGQGKIQLVSAFSDMLLFGFVKSVVLVCTFILLQEKDTANDENCFYAVLQKALWPYSSDCYLGENPTEHCRSRVLLFPQPSSSQSVSYLVLVVYRDEFSSDWHVSAIPRCVTAF